MIYLDNAATSFPKPKGMVEKMTELQLSGCGNPGRAGHRLSKRSAEIVYETRGLLAEMISAENPENIIFTKNATEALNMAVLGSVGRGDHVIATSMEHNSVLRPIAASGAEYSVISCREDGSLDIAEVEAAIKPATKLIACTQASNLTGTIMPVKQLAQLCRKRGIRLLVDASQSAGHMPVSVKDIDLLAAPGHKGLLGPMGTGFLYIRPGLELKPLLYGGTGTLSKILVPEIALPESYEAGTLNVPAIAGLGYSVRWLMHTGIDAGYEQQLHRIFDEALRNMPYVEVYGPQDYRKKVGITAFNIAGRDSSEAASLLNDEFAIAVRPGFHCAGLAHKTIGTWDTGAVRVSAGMFTTRRQMQYAADAVYRIVRTVSGVRPLRCSPAHPRGCSFR